MFLFYSSIHLSVSEYLNRKNEQKLFLVLKEHHPLIFSALCDEQNNEKIAELRALMDICIREENLQKSKQLAQSGGYAFDVSQTVPNTFKFA
jgi:hypothetical protein